MILAKDGCHSMMLSYLSITRKSQKIGPKSVGLRQRKWNGIVSKELRLIFSRAIILLFLKTREQVLVW
jgi:hypothetical protein